MAEGEPKFSIILNDKPNMRLGAYLKPNDIVFIERLRGIPSHDAWVTPLPGQSALSGGGVYPVLSSFRATILEQTIALEFDLVSALVHHQAAQDATAPSEAIEIFFRSSRRRLVDKISQFLAWVDDNRVELRVEREQLEAGLELVNPGVKLDHGNGRII